MSVENDELAEQLKAQLMGSGRKLALEDDEAFTLEDNPLESDFFKAINAFRAARSSGDAEAIADAERRLQDVVRGELTGSGCDETE